MRKTLLQALLILNYVINHESDIDEIDIAIILNGVSFHNVEEMKFLQGKYARDFNREYRKDQLIAAGKNSTMISTFICKHPDGYKSLCFYCYQ